MACHGLPVAHSGTQPSDWEVLKAVAEQGGYLYEGLPNVQASGDLRLADSDSEAERVALPVVHRLPTVAAFLIFPVTVLRTPSLCSDA